MEINEFRERLHEYPRYMEPTTFISTFVDAVHKHQDNLELILQDMEKAKADYETRIENYAKSLNSR
ncbi:hypothetical protein J4433_02745 [Candidatus Pacearchaeota archaeon]|nr:hypothetical protein [Candidatus Pacearchaeota archaeon]